jgi:hypothetical protein
MAGKSPPDAVTIGLNAPAAGSRLLPGAADQARARRKRLLQIAGAAAVLVIAGIAIWIWKRPTATAAPVAFTLTPDPEPPVNPPAAHDWLKVDPAEIPAGELSLAKSLEALNRAATTVSDRAAKTDVSGRAQRWEIRFPFGDTVDSYGQQLDALGIELGVIGSDDTIRYAAGFRRAKPLSRQAPGSEEHRMYMTWHTGAMRDLDATLLSRAGISSSGRIVAQFYPPELEAQLSDLEKEFAGKHDVADVRHTIFGFNAAGNSLEVVEQEYVSGEVKTPTPTPVAKPKPAEKPAEKPALATPPNKLKPRDGRPTVIPRS